MKQDDGQAVTGLDHYVHAVVTLHGRRKQGAGFPRRSNYGSWLANYRRPTGRVFPNRSQTVGQPFHNPLPNPFLKAWAKAWAKGCFSLVLGFKAPHKGLGRGLIGQENHHHDGDVGLREALRMGHEPTRFAHRFRAACFFKHAGHVYSSPCRLLHVGVRQHRRNGIGLFSLSSAPARVHAGGRCRVRTKGLFC